MERVRPITLPKVHYSLVQKVSLFGEAIKFHESLYALPFAYTGMILAAKGFPTWHQLIWISAAMLGARTAGMAANRIIDRHIDASNPRTAERHLPTGKLSVVEMGSLMLISLCVFFYAAAQLNTLALALAPVAGVCLIIYPYTKRITWTANLLLGWVLAIAPSAAWIGVTGKLTWQPILLSLAVALWAGSFDILYHIPDRQFHVRQGLHSVARRFGVGAGFWWARVLDSMAVGCLLVLGIWIGLSWPYFVGLALVTGLLLYKYRLLSPTDTSHLPIAFFRINTYVSTTVLVATFFAVLF